jgi:Raf kinase inhibitor-like YbhB/YbcL family protein
MKSAFTVLLLCLILYSNCKTKLGIFTIMSPGITPCEYIPNKYTPQGADMSPALEWTNAPEGTKSYAIIVDDPDAPKGTWTHWLVKDISSDATKLEEGALIPNQRQVLNSWNIIEYKGPSPPKGQTHRYFFKIFALNTPSINAITKNDFYFEVEKHKIAEASFYAKYKK